MESKNSNLNPARSGGKPIKNLIYVYTGKVDMVIVDGNVLPFSEKLKAETIKTAQECNPNHYINVIEIPLENYLELTDLNYNQIDPVPEFKLNRG